MKKGNSSMIPLGVPTLQSEMVVSTPPVGNV